MSKFNISDKDLEVKIIRVLMANKNKILSHYEVFDRLIDILGDSNEPPSSEFKLRYLTLLQLLPSKYDDISVYKFIKNK